MKIKKSQLLEILDCLRPGLSNDEIIEDSDSICFIDDFIYTYNDRIWVFFPIKIGFSGVVKAEKFLKHIKKAGADKEGFISILENGPEIIIESGKKGKTRAGLPMTVVKEGQGFEVDDLDWYELPEGFTEALCNAAYYTSTNFNKPKLTCVHIAKKIVEGSDGQRGYRQYLPVKIKKEFLIPAATVSALQYSEYCKYALDFENNWVFFKTDEGAITALRMPSEREYVDADFIFEMDGGKEISFPKELSDTVEKAIDFIGQEEQFSYLHIHFDGAKNRIMVSSESDHGWFKDPVKFKSDLQLSFFINPFFLKEIIKKTFKARVNTKVGLLLFEADDWKVVININLD